LRKMLKRNLKELLIVVLNVFSVLLIYFALSTIVVFASGGPIAMVNYFPNDRGTYEFIDHFLEQTTAVNTNTTVSVSIDGGTLIPMTYQGIRNEMALCDTVARDWYTWQIAIPAITAPGKHTFQFFSHYYVWQEVDQYWAEFDSYSDLHSFTIACPSTIPTPERTPTPSPSSSAHISPSPTPMPSPTASPSSSPEPPIPAFPQLFILPLSMITALLLGMVYSKKLNRRTC
jgi:hypothetical protein